MEWVATVATKEAADFYKGAVPLILVKNEDELERMSLLLAKIFKAMIHDLENGIYLIVKH